MKIQQLTCTNYRGIRGEVGFNFADHLNVLFGENGAGKSTVLDAISTLLSWITERVQNPKNMGSRIQIHDIHNAENQASLSFRGDCTELSCRFEYQLTKAHPGFQAKNDSKTKNITDLIYEICSLIELEKGGLPLLAYYPINRAASVISVKIRKKQENGILEIYDQSLHRTANFKQFFEWFRKYEDIENEKYRWSGEQPSDTQLQSVRRAIEKFMPDFTDWRICRETEGMVVKKNGQLLRVEQLSSGEQCLMAMVGDIARRLAIANPKMDNPLNGYGIVLIDEIELHLHPSWQRMIIERLLKTFPNIQFFVSTHSPQVIGEVYADSNGQRIFQLSQSESGITCTTPKQAYGLDSNLILGSMMTVGTPCLSRNKDIAEELHTISRFIDREKFNEARKHIKALERKTNGTLPETVGAMSLIDMLDDTLDGNRKEAP